MAAVGCCKGKLETKGLPCLTYLEFALTAQCPQFKVAMCPMPLTSWMESAQVLNSPTAPEFIGQCLYPSPLAFQEVFSSKGFCIRNMAGDSRTGEEGSDETGTSGLALVMADTSDISVHRTSCVR